MTISKKVLGGEVGCPRTKNHLHHHQQQFMNNTYYLITKNHHQQANNYIYGRKGEGSYNTHQIHHHQMQHKTKKHNNQQMDNTYFWINPLWILLTHADIYVYQNCLWGGEVGVIRTNTNSTIARRTIINLPPNIRWSIWPVLVWMTHGWMLPNLIWHKITTINTPITFMGGKVGVPTNHTTFIKTITNTKWR